MQALDIAATARITLAWAGTGSRGDHCRHGCGDWNRGYCSPAVPNACHALV